MNVIERKRYEERLLELREQLAAERLWWNGREIGLHQALKTETKKSEALAEQLQGAVRAERERIIARIRQSAEAAHPTRRAALTIMADLIATEGGQ